MPNKKEKWKGVPLKRYIACECTNVKFHLKLKIVNKNYPKNNLKEIYDTPYIKECHTIKDEAKMRLPITVSEISELWLDHKKRQIKESSYVKFQNITRKHIIPEFGSRNINSISYDDISHFCMKLASDNENKRALSAKTITDIISVFESIRKYAVSKNYTTSWPKNYFKIKQNRRKLDIISKNDQQCLLKFLLSNLTNRNLGIIICLFTGLRIGEICALKWEDISLIEGTIYVHKTIQRLQVEKNGNKRTHIVITDPKSISSVRKIPLPEEVISLLSCPAINRIGYFLSDTGEKWVEPRVMQYYYKKVLKECGIRYSNFHSLRHTFATRCVEAGCDIKSLSEMLGHANINITMNRYVHPSIDFKRKNIQLLTKEFFTN